ncbi:PREDICTED: glycine-rich cell wall structural protein 1.0-like [Acromyrmex echinatior]|uniref:glycine-rich cell wall structural protein 1.0-like n=1 Tax=Acromyrmex echinatior TaxID=103372 RepID=UPI000580B6DC|nr:PREDICTED: glycine-rich cell wall structural protein 1.0-like [Acromyrmex echinatior]
MLKEVGCGSTTPPLGDGGGGTNGRQIGANEGGGGGSGGGGGGGGGGIGEGALGCGGCGREIAERWYLRAADREYGLEFRARRGAILANKECEES